MSISVVILTYNSEAVLRATVESARRVSDDIHVVDSYSEDSTPELAKELAKEFDLHFLQHEFIHYGAQRNWAMEHLPLKHSWELHLDADERLSEELIQEITRLKDRFPEEVVGYHIPRLTVFLGKELRRGGLYPIWHMRLFRRGRGRCENRLYDQHYYVDGTTRKLSGHLIDDQKMSVAEWIARHNRWSDAEVDELLGSETEGRVVADISGNPVEQKRALRSWYYKAPLFLRAFLFFVYRYVFRLGFLDGTVGLIYCFLQSFWYRFLIDTKLYERKINLRSPETS